MTKEFTFPLPPDLSDNELMLVSAGHCFACKPNHHIPCYRFEMRHRDSGAMMGRISLLITDADSVVNGAGHSGFSVSPECRGHRYAARSIKLIAALARQNGMQALFLSCKSNNVACQRTCELAGATRVDAGSSERCRYRLNLQTEKS